MIPLALFSLVLQYRCYTDISHRSRGLVKGKGDEFRKSTKAKECGIWVHAYAHRETELLLRKNKIRFCIMINLLVALPCLLLLLRDPPWLDASKLAAARAERQQQWN